jgi:hypothetical protein
MLQQEDIAPELTLKLKRADSLRTRTLLNCAGTVSEGQAAGQADTAHSSIYRTSSEKTK